MIYFTNLLNILTKVIVGTPGRTIDLLNRGVLDLSDLRSLVLDECDEMLNMGF
jgi:ATP-dependent RNA helicase DeaD